MAERIDLEFMGTVSRPLSLDPAEFRGQPVERIEGEIRKLLKGIGPEVSFFSDDIALAAQVIFDDPAAR